MFLVLERVGFLAAFVSVKNVYKKYKMGTMDIVASDSISFEIMKGEFCVIVGPSGAGKTTVLNILGGMDNCDEGSVIIDGNDISKYSPKQLTTYRRNDVGFVFQFYNLVPNLTALENVELASQIKDEAQKPEEALKSVGLGERLSNFPSELSGGEQQRVAIARALAKKPKLLLCDEPTGALDFNTGKSVLELLQKTCKDTKTTVILITHNQAITPCADRVIEIYNGKVRDMKKNKTPTPVANIEW